MTNFKMTIKANCIVFTCNPLLSMKSPAHWLSVVGESALGQEFTLPLVSGIQNKANFPFHQPCLFNGFWTVSTETPLLFIRQMDLKKRFSYIHSGLLLSHKKEWNKATCSNMDGRRGYHTKWSMSDRSRQIPYDTTYIWNLKYDTYELIYKTEIDSQT